MSSPEGSFTGHDQAAIDVSPQGLAPDGTEVFAVVGVPVEGTVAFAAAHAAQPGRIEQFRDAARNRVAKFIGTRIAPALVREFGRLPDNLRNDLAQGRVGHGIATLQVMADQYANTPTNQPQQPTPNGGNHNRAQQPITPAQPYAQAPRRQAGAQPVQRLSMMPSSGGNAGSGNTVPTQRNALTAQPAPIVPGGSNNPNNPNNPGGNNPNLAPRNFDLDFYEDNLRDIFSRYENDLQTLSSEYNKGINSLYDAMEGNPNAQPPRRAATPEELKKLLKVPGIDAHASYTDRFFHQYRAEIDQLMTNARDEAWRRLTDDERNIFTKYNPDKPDDPSENGIIPLLNRNGATASGAVEIKLQRILNDPNNSHKRYAEIVLHDVLHTVVESTHWDDPQSRQRTNAVIGSFRTLLENQKGELSREEKRHIYEQRLQEATIEAQKRGDPIPKVPEPKETAGTRTLAFNNVVRIAVDIAERSAAEELQRSRLVTPNGKLDYVTFSPPQRVGKTFIRGEAVATQDYLGLRAHTPGVSHYANRAASGDIAARVIGNIDNIIWEQGEQVVANIVNHTISPQVGNILLNDILESASSDEAAEMIYYCLTGRKRSGTGNPTPQPASRNQPNANALPPSTPLGLPQPGRTTP